MVRIILKKNKIGRLFLHDLKTCYKVTIIIQCGIAKMTDTKIKEKIQK